MLHGDHMHEPPSEEEMFVIDQQSIGLQDFECDGYILDIGGGGEGAIGILKGERVIAIDTRKHELEEAPQGPLKIVMDAKDLQFLDNTFGTVTSFFTLMYVQRIDRKPIIEEVYRVLKPGGNFFIWDVVIPPKSEDKVWFVVPVAITVHGRKIETGYGVGWEPREQDLDYYTDLVKTVGFEVVEHTEEDQHFFIHLRKPG
jgi:ubiquinone/menaquinone biosynthesis C-methylase UbiE